MKTKTFIQIINFEKLIKSVADGYKTRITHDLWLTEGLQKDAIQNSCDARIDKKYGNEWECGFFIKHINNKKFLCIVDRGTTGLRGTKFSTQKDLSKILIKNKPGEDLAYFLNSNWSAKSAEEGGDIGRGKTLFLVASTDKRIFFDSLRHSDNAYIFGELYLDTDKQVKFNIYYDDEAKQMFKGFTMEEIPSLVEHGTRIFISNPEKTIEEALGSGEIISFIGHSWWEIIKNNKQRFSLITMIKRNM